ncbi:MAG TPA: methyltransferase domain-containing protein [Thermoanaerobaculia bacterium]|jgi:ubiquinone/menaquinone biosynthesis C-methylase UbiE|nr:methyltransferase domain-containing protein [Thermoanaerobaculia bacterium]
MSINTNRWNRARYTLYAPFYDLLARRLGTGRRRAIELLNVQPGERVLIDGCGTGLDLELLPRDCRITAIDLTPVMVEKTRARAEALGLSIDARVMDAASLDFADESFDCVVLHLILAVVPDPHSTAREAARVLRRGGRASIFDKFASGRVSLARRVLNVVTNFFATDITRRLEDVLAGTELQVVREEKSVFGGVFRVVIAARAT